MDTRVERNRPIVAEADSVLDGSPSSQDDCTEHKRSKSAHVRLDDVQSQRVPRRSLLSCRETAHI